MNELWPQQEAFCRKVKSFAEKEGLVSSRGAINIPALAARLDLAPSTVKQFLQNKRRPRPHFDTLKVVASVLGCDPLEFWEPSDEAPAGIVQDRWSNLSPKKRALAELLLEDLMVIPDGEEEAYLDLFRHGIRIGLQKTLRR